MIKRMLALGMCAAVLSATAALAPAQDKKNVPEAKIGQKAPNFTLTDLQGKVHSLTDYEGKVVVIEWTNPDCPFIDGVYAGGVVKETIETMKGMGKDYVYIAVNSTANIPQEEVIEKNIALLKKNEVRIRAMVDYDGTVGRLYGARTTPHMFVIDNEGVLRYNGAYTDDFKKGTDATNYVINALEQMATGETVYPDRAKPWGCSVKYASK